jgi:endonuclease-3 related protein
MKYLMTKHQLSQDKIQKKRKEGDKPDQKKILQIYASLYDAYGPQGWWPIGGTYEKKRERCLSEKERFEIMIGAILTQNTAWKNVEQALQKLDRQNAIRPKEIIAMHHEQLSTLIRSAGYYNQKAERLKIFSQFLIKNPTQELSKKETLKLREQLLSIKGIGPETADSMMLYALDKPIFVIDAYTKRIMSRIGLCSQNITYEEAQKMMHKTLMGNDAKQNIRTYQEYHALLVELAKKHCRSKPECTGCPIKSICHTGKAPKGDIKLQNNLKTRKKTEKAKQSIKPAL